MMPISHRLGAPFGSAAAQPAVTRVRMPARSANSSTLAIVVATSFALLTAIVSLVPDSATQAPADDLALAHLRGALPAIAETTP